jgi:lipoyl(octanoyl) transferase
VKPSIFSINKSVRQLKVLYNDLVPYDEALSKQVELLEKKRKDPNLPDILWLLSHPEVITFGARRSSEANLLQETSIPIHKISRGGDITYHDPGQVTGYLIFSLNEDERDLKRFLHLIEESVIHTIQDIFKMATTGSTEKSDPVFHRVEGKTGVFCSEKKICSIGIACRHWITFHGFSLNFHSKLENFAIMNPCGLKSSLMGNLDDLTPVKKGTFLKKYPETCAHIFSRELSELSNV